MPYVELNELSEYLTPDKISSVGSWKRLLKEAELKVDEVTFNRIKGAGFENLTPFQQRNIKQAVCYQACYIAETSSDNSDISSYSVGSISISVKDNTTAAERLKMDSAAWSLLKQTGLTARLC